MKLRLALQIFVLGTIASFSCRLAQADPNMPPRMSSNIISDNAREMNGITYDQFGDFTKTWHFVTVRFRRDTAEMRFAYANDIAWKALLEHSIDYPDGAVFAKIGVATDEDPSFVDSFTPSGGKRIQFMVRDHNKYKGTDGWGYAVFNDRGAVLIGETRERASQACNACHQVVKNKGLIFVEPMGNLFPSDVAAVDPVPKREMPADIPFVTVDRASLPDFVQQQVPPFLRQVRMLGGSMPTHVFHGTTYEAMPMIQAEAVRANMPAVLIGQNATPEFSLAWPAALTDKNAKPCKLPGGRKGTIVVGGRTITLPGNPFERRYMYQRSAPYCSPAGPITPSKTQ